MWLDLRTAATLAVTALLGASFAGEAAGQVDDAAEATAGCESTAAFTAPNTTGLAAEFVSAGAFTAQGSAAPGFGPDYSRLPTFCCVTGSGSSADAANFECAAP